MTIQCPNCHDANKYGDYEGPSCEVCLGVGQITDTEHWVTCVECCGEGAIETLRPFYDDPYYCESRKCEACGGAGRLPLRNGERR